jgi:hypothetical protein
MESSPGYQEDGLETLPETGGAYYSGLPQEGLGGNALKLSLGLTLVASTIANVALGYPNITEVDVPVGREGTAPTKEKAAPVTLDVPSDERWARLFSSDQEAGKLTSVSELTTVTRKISNILKSGKKIDRITIQGFASDEDDNTDSDGIRTGGLQEPSQQNVELADTRATIFDSMLRQELKDENIDIPKVIMKTPVEDMLSSVQIEGVEGLVHKYGYTGVEPMISAYNRNQGVPKEVKRKLDNLLAAERKVVVTIDASEVHPGTPPQHSEHKIEVPIPLFLIIPIPKPVPRRNRSGSEESLRTGLARYKGGISAVPVLRAYEPIIKRSPNGPSKQFRPVSRQIRIQPRPHNFHGVSRSASKNVGRDKGGGRRGARTRIS